MILFEQKIGVTDTINMCFEKKSNILLPIWLCWLLSNKFFVYLSWQQPSDYNNILLTLYQLDKKPRFSIRIVIIENIKNDSNLTSDIT